MAPYLVLIQENAPSEASREEWEQFFSAAKASGLFQGGSAIGSRVVLGDISSAKSTAHIAGYMRFDSDDRAKLLDLLSLHPVVVHGGSIELCELPKSE